MDTTIKDVYEEIDSLRKLENSIINSNHINDTKNMIECLIKQEDIKWWHRLLLKFINKSLHFKKADLLDIVPLLQWEPEHSLVRKMEIGEIDWGKDMYPILSS